MSEVFYVLRTPNRQDTLNGYVFVDEDHAKQWMKQSFTEGHRVETWQGRRAACSCGRQKTVKLTKRIDARFIVGGRS